MIVIVTENAPLRLRGRLSLWLLEVRAGTFVGAYGRRARERIWADVCRLIGGGTAMMAWSAPTESGFAFETVGADRREPVEIDGMMLVRCHPRNAEAA